MRKLLLWTACVFLTQIPASAQIPAERHPDLVPAYASAPAYSTLIAQDPNLPANQQHDLVTFKGDIVTWEVWSVDSKEAASALDHRVVMNDIEHPVVTTCADMFPSQNGGKPYLCPITLPAPLNLGTNVIIGRTYDAAGKILSETYPPLVVIKDSEGGPAGPAAPASSCVPGTYKVKRITNALVLEQEINAAVGQVTNVVATANAIYVVSCQTQ